MKQCVCRVKEQFSFKEFVEYVNLLNCGKLFLLWFSAREKCNQFSNVWHIPDPLSIPPNIMSTDSTENIHQIPYSLPVRLVYSKYLCVYCLFLIIFFNLENSLSARKSQRQYRHCLDPALTFPGKVKLYFH